MDTESRQASRVLEAVAASNERFIALAQSLRARPEVEHTSHLLLLRNYQVSGPKLGVYVDAKLENGQSLVWSLDIAWNSVHWMIESAISVIHETEAEGEDTLKRYPDRVAETIDELTRHLQDATSDLISSAEMPRLDRFAVTGREDTA